MGYDESAALLASNKKGNIALDLVPFIPFGSDQAQSLEVDNVVSENGTAAFGRGESDLTILASYLGVT